MDNYERLVDDGTVPVPYYTGLKEPNDLYDDDIERQLDKLMKLKAEYITQAQRLENVSGIKVLDVDENIYIGFKKGFADRYIKTEMERLAKQFNSTLFITPDYKSGISKAFFQVQKNFTLINIVTAKEAEIMNCPICGADMNLINDGYYAFYLCPICGQEENTNEII